MAAADQPVDRVAVLASLRARVARLERGAASEAGSIALCDTIDRHLPNGGLARAALHEVRAADPGAAAGFCALVLARATGTALWISPVPDAWPPGLAAFGLAPADLVLVRAERPADGLWAFEEALRCPAVAGALLVLRGALPDMVAARRLQLAAEAGGGIGLLLLPDTTLMPPSPARSRWRVEATATEDREHPCWQLTLLRCAGGRGGAWSVTWRRDKAMLETVARTALARQAGSLS
ncbi:hypothetical protein M0638_26610 [Roseomonas sp. NAR14]|uniref:Protein ImuA n=1 Tax=Roseomonas acroporae TaxID=2937791 RepID=A0A9X2BWR7_9PROT|nr:hypothetical protein [Roseomonas acroporae]MCK8787932.1 hypothetical protein [Roseomonas acroporae]